LKWRPSFCEGEDIALPVRALDTGQQIRRLIQEQAKGTVANPLVLWFKNEIKTGAEPAQVTGHHLHGITL
jgi:hypothetical protein